MRAALVCVGKLKERYWREACAEYEKRLARYASLEILEVQDAPEPAHEGAGAQAQVLRAEGEAEAIMKVQTALADSIKLLNSANPNDQVVKLKALESFEKAADGQATKIIVPSEIQSLAGLAASFKGLLEDEKK